MKGSRYLKIHAFLPIFWYMLGQESQNVAPSSKSFIPFQVNASNMFRWNVHKHWCKGVANLVSLTAEITQPSCVLAYIVVHFGSKITQLALSSKTFIQIQAKPLNMFITNVHKHGAKDCAQPDSGRAHITPAFMHLGLYCGACWLTNHRMWLWHQRPFTKSEQKH